MVILVLGASALAIALLVVLNFIIGGWAPARLHTPEAAARALSDGVFGFRCGDEIGLSVDGRGALVLEAGGDRLGLAYVFGDRITVRALRAGDLKAVRREGARLSLELNDYTFPAAQLRFADAASAQRWEARALALTPTSSPARGAVRHA